jgi:tripartite-type tricarboxylate transporter receptor subunit TctC
MKYVVKDSDGKKMIMTVVSSIPQLPEGFEVLGLADEMPEVMAEITAAEDLAKAKADARKLLADTDWKVIRHRDQIDAGLPTSMSAEEFTQLLNDRQAARDSI